MKTYKRDFSGELRFRFSRSSGPGGQNVNKVSTRVEAIFSIESSALLSGIEKMRLYQNLSSKISSDGDLVVVSQDSRSQLQNKTNAIDKLNLLINRSIVPVKKRIATKPSRAAKLRRMEHKKRLGLKKINRRKPPI